MNKPFRPDPDALLAELNRQASQQGRLRIFFGMCPGAGKTYAMLQAARQRKAEGVDVVIGLVETHGRPETTALLEGLEVLPRTCINYRGTVLKEMHLDGLLLRKPRLAVVDELAHTNAPGSRHPKRCADVLELLEAGIDVYTTLNVQHVESRAPVVRQVTGVTVRETVPDSVLDRADEIELIDISPEQLRKRLAEGRVYLGDRAAAAGENFFRESNLTALREMALRLTAERVDQGMREHMREQRIAGPWKARERLLVGVGPSPFAGDLVRWTRRIADALDATWMAVYVDDGHPLTEEEKKRVTEFLALARRLGGEVESVSGSRVAGELMRVAREQNVTQIVVGKPRQSLWMRLLSGGSLVDELLHRSGDIDVYVVRPEKSAEAVRTSRTREGVHFREWGWGLLLLAGVTLAGWMLCDWVGYLSVALFYLLMTVTGALFLRRRVVLVTAAAGAFLWNLLFVPPLFTFRIAQFHDAMMFFLLIVVALVMGHLTTRMRQREEGERQRQKSTAALLKLTRSSALNPDMNDGLCEALDQINALFSGKTVLYLRDLNTRQLNAKPHAASLWTPSSKEYSVAEWAFSNRRIAGRFTDTLPGAEGTFWPLQTRTSLMGVLGLRLGFECELNLPERDLLASFATQLALALEKDHFRAAFQRSEVLDASNRLRRVLLDNVSHELRTPLTALKAALTALKSIPQTGELLEEAEAASDRLTNMVDLLVDSARLETAQPGVKKEWCEISDLIEDTVRLCRKELMNRPVRINLITPDLLVLTDTRLLQQALIHIIRNAGIHTPAGSDIEILARINNGNLEITVRDHGTGFADPVRAFEKFYRDPHAPAGGLGLGLSITRGLISALNGQVDACNRPDKGAEVTVSVPVEARMPEA
ncbi:MAG TPA: sensor histidine kinase KdpD [Pontiellaceae bacterium]|nr:sensor histidine kinase KdpD [Pontiellaceae bacterium]HPR83347.1 sensor histidine kinase KdpD [Pontiellaceae bacterium]